ncbi:MAG: hypothetical protein U0326_38385 [Polyangiales bacterium]
MNAAIVGQRASRSSWSARATTSATSRGSEGSTSSTRCGGPSRSRCSSAGWPST